MCHNDNWKGVCPQFFHELEFYCEEFNRRVYISGTLWTEFILMEKHFIDAQGHILEHKKLYQDKNSTMFKENIGRASRSKRAKHINARYFL